jgi:hypothetical protein
VETSTKYPVAPLEVFQFAINEVALMPLAAFAVGGFGEVQHKHVVTEMVEELLLVPQLLLALTR